MDSSEWELLYSAGVGHQSLVLGETKGGDGLWW